ncbi:unnamed protein product [Phytophthora fragariaefolia]|uniref:Unnamed protein product n=1 Tax=Phytophthora fragariaefolia TaxID=1490495 RepID=A0A9W6XZG4_9STRA|nr:unnamed protein product [Phytophthora fragariaefolia]
MRRFTDWGLGEAIDLTGHEAQIWGESNEGPPTEGPRKNSTYLKTEPHQDYQSSELVQARTKDPNGVLGSMIFALEPDTKLRVYKGYFTAKIDSEALVVQIPARFCVLLRGDLIHNGTTFSSTNHRLYCYLTSEGVSWTPNVVQNVLPEHGECRYCGAKMLKGS